jgi:hypothetical protein
MVLTAPPDASPARGETSAWMVAAMAGCLVVLVGLGLHVPGDLAQLLADATHRLITPQA